MLSGQRNIKLKMLLFAQHTLKCGNTGRQLYLYTYIPIYTYTSKSIKTGLIVAVISARLVGLTVAQISR
jgi:hypothetical protein